MTGATDGVLLAIDRVDASEVLIRAAADLATNSRMALTALHVLTSEMLETLRESASAERRFTDTIYADLIEDLTRRITTSSPGDSLTVRVKIVEGEPDEEIPKVLRKGNYAYGVVGVRGRSRVGKLIFGSTAQSVLLLSPCPVLAVPLGTHNG